MKVGFEMMRCKPDPDKFNRPNLPIGILLEGTFGSLFENRLDEDMNNILSSIGIPLKQSVLQHPCSLLQMGMSSKIYMIKKLENLHP
ncbi:MAG: hypothetical protein IPG55_05410 [Saprospiraceae bacterium]|nr:hypothetical protein [Candidatus Defluviibacterium haderslevense]